MFHSGCSVFSILTVDSGSSCLFSLSLPSLLISSRASGSDVFAGILSFIEPRVCDGPPREGGFIDLLLELGSWFGPSNFQLITGSGFHLIAPGPFLRIVLEHNLCAFVASLFLSALWSASLRALRISEASSSHAAFRSRPQLPLCWQLDAVDASLENILFILQASASLVYTFKWAAVGATGLCWALFCPCGKDSLLSLNLHSQH